MEKYRLVQEHKDAATVAAMDASFDDSVRGNNHHKNNNNTNGFPVVRITQQGKPRNYISYAMGLFSEGAQTILIKAMGRAINKAVTITEILKRKMPLHQQNILSSIELIDVYEPVEEGLDTVTSHRYVSCMKIILSLHVKDIDVNHPGYQSPLPVEEMATQAATISSGSGGGSRSRSSGGESSRRHLPQHRSAFVK